MAQLTPITGKNQVDTKDHAAVDAIVLSHKPPSPSADLNL
jgi:hypothetical protein